MPLINKKGKAPATKPKAQEQEEVSEDVVTREEFDALKTSHEELSAKLDELVESLNSEEEAPPAEEEATEEETAEETTEEEETSAGDEEEVAIPTVAEIKKASTEKLKEWRKLLFDVSDAKRPLEEIRKELLEVAKSAEGAEAEETVAEGEEEEVVEEEETTEEAVEEEEEEKPAAKPKAGKGTNGNVFGFIQDPKTKLVKGETMKPILQCKTDRDKALRLANTYACLLEEKDCLCKTGDPKSIASCWAEYLADPDTKKQIAKEKTTTSAPAAKGKPPLKRK